MLLYLSRLDESAGKVCAAMKGRAMLNAGQKPYLSVRIAPGQSPLDTVSEALDAMDGE